MVWLLAAVLLTPPFGAAAATVEAEPSGGMTVRLSVEVEAGPTAVVARVVFADGSASAVALAPGDGGVWSGSLQVERRENARVAFEAIDGEGSATASPPATLTALGADAAVVSPHGAVPDPPPPQDRFPWGPVGLATGLAALALLALWAFPARRRDLDKQSGFLDDTANAE